ncbi:transglutaminase family protein [Roseicyclus sp. F158]|uniref:Transglutaminase family protein n=1 Tax=Tropicimonas omnivorans TaxID=3075590 RepID=A0ABU3DFN1_9RHOB|nr:transglutaminase family protein [Roseicyclus sp. F158]MDT0682504.1 transglutaminase family protein [Roseicyclus sp. F158]
MRLRIRHTTSYEFGAPASYGLQQIRLTPKSRIGQSVLTWDTQIEGGRVETEFDDHNMNRVILASFTPGAEHVTITCDGEVETADTSGVVGQHAGYTPLWYFLWNTDLSRPGERITSLIEGLKDEGDLVTRMHALSGRIAESVAYETGRTSAITTAEEALGEGRGVCQDHAHIFCAAARAMGLPARYVSGYLLMDDRTEQEATHAWAETHIDGLGWVGFDVSNAISPDMRYVRVATGLDYKEAAPIAGLHYGASSGAMPSVQIEVQQQ